MSGTFSVIAVLMSLVSVLSLLPNIWDLSDVISAECYCVLYASATFKRAYDRMIPSK